MELFTTLNVWVITYNHEKWRFFGFHDSMISIHWVIHGQSTNSPRITYPSKKKRPLLTRIIHWFPFIRPAIQPLFLRGYVRAGRLTSHISVFADVLELFPSIEISKSKNCRVVSHEFLCFTNSFSSCSNRTSMEQANYRLVNQLFVWTSQVLNVQRWIVVTFIQWRVLLLMVQKSC